MNVLSDHIGQGAAVLFLAILDGGFVPDLLIAMILTLRDA